VAETGRKPTREIARPFLADGPSGVSIRDRLKGLTPDEETVLRLVGEHMGRLASRDLARRCRDGLEHSTDTWAERKRDLTAESSSRWAGSVTSNTHDQWGLSRRAQWRHLQSLDAAHKTEAQWRAEWETARWFLTADGESGKRFGNETIRLTPDGEISIKLPAPLADLANAGHGRYVLAARVSFPHRGTEWRDRITANRAVAYRIHYDVQRGRWYIDASWTRKDLPVVPLDALQAGGVIGVDTNADHLAAWRLDEHGNPVGAPRRFDYDMTGTVTRRDAQLRHALTHLLHWAKATDVQAIAIEDLDFTDSKTREKNGRRKRFRQLISGIPTGKLRARLLAMCAEAGLGVIAVDPAYTSTWGAEQWQTPLSTPRRPASRHQAASVAIGRRALGHRIRRRTAPPPHDQSDRAGHRTAQARPDGRGREGNRPRVSGPLTRSDGAGRRANAVDQPIQDRSGWAQCQTDLHGHF
jgi:IS605 OrfB family transposase